MVSAQLKKMFCVMKGGLRWRGRKGAIGKNEWKHANAAMVPSGPCALYIPSRTPSVCFRGRSIAEGRVFVLNTARYRRSRSGALGAEPSVARAQSSNKNKLWLPIVPEEPFLPEKTPSAIMNILTCTILSALALGCHAQAGIRTEAKITLVESDTLYHTLYLEYLAGFSKNTPSSQTPNFASSAICLPTSLEIPVRFSYSSLPDADLLRNQINIASAVFAPLAVSFFIESVNWQATRVKERDDKVHIPFDTPSDVSAKALIQALGRWLGLDGVKGPRTRHQRAHVFATYFSLRKFLRQDGTHCNSRPILSQERMGRRPSPRRSFFNRRGGTTLQQLEKLASSTPDTSSRIFVDAVTGEVLVCSQRGGCEPPSGGGDQPQPVDGTESGDLRRREVALAEGGYSGHAF